MKNPKTIRHEVITLDVYWHPEYFGERMDPQVKVRARRHPAGTITYQFYAPYLASWEDAEKLTPSNFATVKNALQ